MKQIFKITIIALTLSFVASSSVKAQTEKRYIFNLASAIEKEFNDYLTAGFELEGEICPDPSTKTVMFKPVVEFSPIQYLSFEAEYRFKAENEEGESAWHRRFGIAAKGKYAFNHLKLSTRLKYCLYSDDYDEDTKERYFRTRFQAQYKIKPIKLTPYISYEWFYNIPRGLVDRDRWTFGVEKKLNKRNTLGLEYQCEERFNRTNAKRTKLKNDIAENTFSITYKFEL